MKLSNNGLPQSELPTMKGRTTTAPRRQVQCPSCPFTTTCRTSLARHLTRHTSARPYTCSHCPLTFKLKSILDRHVTRRHGAHNGEYPSSPASGKSSCEPGKSSFESANSPPLSVKFSPTPSKSFHCPHCPFITAYKGNLKDHLGRHSDVLLSCDKCDYKTKSLKNLSKHRLHHQQGKRYRCSSCAYATHERCSLTKHVALHTGDRRLTCSACGYTSSDKSNMTRHTRLHCKVAKSRSAPSVPGTQLVEQEPPEQDGQLAGDASPKDNQIRTVTTRERSDSCVDDTAVVLTLDAVESQTVGGNGGNHRSKRQNSCTRTSTRRSLVTRRIKTQTSGPCSPMEDLGVALNTDLLTKESRDSSFNSAESPPLLRAFERVPQYPGSHCTSSFEKAPETIPGLPPHSYPSYRMGEKEADFVEISIEVHPEESMISSRGSEEVVHPKGYSRCSHFTNSYSPHHNPSLEPSTDFKEIWLTPIKHCEVPSNKSVSGCSSRPESPIFSSLNSFSHCEILRQPYQPRDVTESDLTQTSTPFHEHCSINLTSEFTCETEAEFSLLDISSSSAPIDSLQTESTMPDLRSDSPVPRVETHPINPVNLRLGQSSELLPIKAVNPGVLNNCRSTMSGGNRCRFANSSRDQSRPADSECHVPVVSRQCQVGCTNRGVDDSAARVDPCTSRVHSFGSKIDPGAVGVHPSVSRVQPYESEVDPSGAEIDPCDSRINPCRAEVDPPRIGPVSMVVPLVDTERREFPPGTIFSNNTSTEDSLILAPPVNETTVGGSDYDCVLSSSESAVSSFLDGNSIVAGTHQVENSYEIVTSDFVHSHVDEKRDLCFNDFRNGMEVNPGKSSFSVDELTNKTNNFPGSWPTSCAFCSIEIHSLDALIEHNFTVHDLMVANSNSKILPNETKSFSGPRVHSKMDARCHGSGSPTLPDHEPGDVSTEIHQNLAFETRIDTSSVKPKLENVQESSSLEDELQYPRQNLIKKKTTSKKSNQIMLVCLVCGFKTNMKRCYRAHCKTHRSEKPFTCSLCPFKTKYKNSLKVHVKLKHEPKPKEVQEIPLEILTCPHCDFTSTHPSSLRRHLKRHTLPDSDQPQLSCQYCDQLFADRLSLLHHSSSTHSNEKRFACSICGYTTEFTRILKAHVVRHLKKTSCGEEPSESAVLKHTNLPEVPKERRPALQCKLCSYTCINRSSLNKHRNRAHPNHGSISCPVCSFTCDSQKTLHTHTRVHVHELPFACDTCGYRCRTRYLLNKHEQRHVNDRTVYSCHKCTFTTSAKSSIVLHMKYHPNRKEYTCLRMEEEGGSPSKDGDGEGVTATITLNNDT